MPRSLLPAVALALLAGASVEAQPQGGGMDVAQALAAAHAASPRDGWLADQADDWAEADRDYPQELDDSAREARVRLLQNEIETARAFDRAFSWEQIATTCLGQALEGCGVTAAGLLYVDRDEAVAWQTVGGHTDMDGIRAGFVILARDGDGWRPFGWGYDGVIYEAPSLGGEMDQTLIHVPGRMMGTGNGNADQIYVRQGDGGWRDLRLMPWKREMRARLPGGLEVWKGVDYRIGAMMALTQLWRPTDGNCCPTGGDAIINLAVEGDRLAVTDMSVRRVEDLIPRN
ncbi:hypothetical protein Q0812_06035 [Brevundimonas sp. 2R-24]|uniref:Uncharacterized protein n=1 Tax=Peiella sedimenti TaxID=3061083 RepID=A0ABT8SK90_9CAUL|nr:hypothetical protein [Caulobacteraceae bacterium XZ-24]